jgi:hypothetical protein
MIDNIHTCLIEWHKYIFLFTVPKNLFLFTVQKYMPDDLPMIDDNSDLTLLGYKNILIEPQVPIYCAPCSTDTTWINKNIFTDFFHIKQNIIRW